MNWRDVQIETDSNGEPMFAGSIGLNNDRNEMMAAVLWSYDGGPFYAYAMDPGDTTVFRWIGPHRTLEDAKAQCLDALEGRILDLNNRASFPR